MKLFVYGGWMPWSPQSGTCETKRIHDLPDYCTTFIVYTKSSTWSSLVWITTPTLKNLQGLEWHAQRYCTEANPYSILFCSPALCGLAFSSSPTYDGRSYSFAYMIGHRRAGLVRQNEWPARLLTTIIVYTIRGTLWSELPRQDYKIAGRCAPCTIRS